jgi:DHA1 family bicyclomycin/chloramphenicol resistance-like MFS transporter
MSTPFSAPPLHAPARTGALALLLAALAMIGPFSIDTYLPSFPAIEADLRVSSMHIQQTLSVYLLGFAVMTLFHGTISDSFGRRPVILANLLLFTLASAGCAFAASFEQLLAFRAVQGLSAGAGIVVGRAIIRDTLQGDAAQRLMSLVTMLFGVAPAIAPVIGGWLQSALGWRSVFIFLAIYGAALFLACRARLAESLPRMQRQPFALRPLALNYWTLGRSFPLFLLSSAIALNFCGFFVYIVSAPAFVYRILGLDATQFAWLFVPGIAGVTLGAFLSGRLAGRLSPRATVTTAYAIIFGAVALNLAYCAIGTPRVPWSVLPVMVYSTGMALAMPSLTLLALDLFPHNRGLASSLMGFEHSFTSAIVAGAISPLLAGSAIALAAGMGTLASAGCLCWLAYLSLTRKAALSSA